MSATATAPRIRPHRRPDREPCTLDGCERPLYCRALCVMHYERLRTFGDVGPVESKRRPFGTGTIIQDGYHVIVEATHPLARAQGKLRFHRKVLFDAIGWGPHPCHWCAIELHWLTDDPAHRLNVDHLDDNRLNNDLANLVPSCLDCNTKRGRA